MDVDLCDDARREISAEAPRGHRIGRRSPRIRDKTPTTNFGDGMNIQSLTACALAVLMSANAHAAYKCVVDGKTTYQERPCDDDIKKKGGETVVAPPARRADLVSPGTVVTKEENAKRSASVKTDYEPLARSAFAAYTEGRMMDYRDMTCLRTRQMLSKPQAAAMISNEGKVWATRKIRLVELEPPSTPLMLTFKASEQVDANKNLNKTPKQLFVNVSLEIEDGKPCIAAFSEWSRDIR
jgi:hypothetical protein